MGEWVDDSVLEAVSWRLASELVRRHPTTTRLLRTHPGGGQSDCLTVTTPTANGGVIQLNRRGTIQVQERFDGRQIDEWEPTAWDEYLRAEPKRFLQRLEQASGLPAPAKVPVATPSTLTLRVLAALAATAVKSSQRIEIEPGYIDSSGYGSGPNRALDDFVSIPDELRRPRPDDVFGMPGYRFWIVRRDGVAILAFEHREGLAWTARAEAAVDVMASYGASGRNVAVVTLDLLRRVDESGPGTPVSGQPVGSVQPVASMTRSALAAWAVEHGDGVLVSTADQKYGITSKLLRFGWNDTLTVAVGSDASAKTRINAVLDALAIALAEPAPGSTKVNLIVGSEPTGHGIRRCANTSTRSRRSSRRSSPGRPFECGRSPPAAHRSKHDAHPPSSRPRRPPSGRSC